MTLHDATRAQHEAADPGASTWLSANAGAGKTRVLTDRVARLLLEHVNPQNILCLTYTKAAASEMQNRLFARLGAWAMRDDDALRGELAGLGVGRSLGAADLAHARTLFARAIETPGGLKIQTIHSFCAALLRRFPLEATVSPHFAEMDETAARLLRNEVVETMAEGSGADAVAALAEHVTGDEFGALTAEIARHRDRFARPISRADTLEIFGVPANATPERAVAHLLDADAVALLRRLAAACENGSTRDAEACARIRALNLDAPGPDEAEALEALLLFGAGAAAPFGAKVGKFPTRNTRVALGADAEAIDALMRRTAAARTRRLALLCAEKTAALHAFAQPFLAAYAAAKEARGWLDFDDLILKACGLLTDAALADWVLYRLDGGIDHILVDEAQDTSPEQWSVIERLAAEFAAGRGARGDTLRTIFVVGDKKQSIYSFQGADPEAFDRMHDHFSDRLAGGEGLNRQMLEFSFRSSPAILTAVDTTFAGMDDTGLGAVSHLPFHGEMAGRVDLWPVVPIPETEDEGVWFDPVDKPAPNAPHVVLARRIAHEIRSRIDAGETIPTSAGRRRLTAGDVLILVRRRSALFHEIIRACKAEGLDVAGADRLRLAAELAVRDLIALLSFVALPEDDLSLAAVLRSPLFGWSEAQLYELATGRDGYLWQALRGRDHTAVATLRDLLDAADFLRPYELLERILVRHRGRARLLARLGVEAEDAIDELLNQAIGYERLQVPSLTGFLAWIHGEDVEVRREAAAAGNKIRVMTVHGAKGLESPVVILPDTLASPTPMRDEILFAGDVPCWKVRREQEVPPLDRARAERAEVDRKERLRLLYVAMTRAKTWLIVCGAGRWTEEDEVLVRSHPQRPYGGQGRSARGAGWRGGSAAFTRHLERRSGGRRAVAGRARSRPAASRRTGAGAGRPRAGRLALRSGGCQGAAWRGPRRSGCAAPRPADPPPARASARPSTCRVGRDGGCAAVGGSRCHRYRRGRRAAVGGLPRARRARPRAFLRAGCTGRGGADGAAARWAADARHRRPARADGGPRPLHRLQDQSRGPGHARRGAGGAAAPDGRLRPRAGPDLSRSAGRDGDPLDRHRHTDADSRSAAGARARRRLSLTALGRVHSFAMN